MKLILLNGEYAFSQLATWPHDFDLSQHDDFKMVAVSNEEITLLCRDNLVPTDTLKTEYGWVVFKIDAVMEFSLVGIMAKLSGVLAEVGVSIMAMATFDTDYVAIKSVDLAQAWQALEQAGYSLERK